MELLWVIAALAFLFVLLLALANQKNSDQDTNLTPDNPIDVERKSPKLPDRFIVFDLETTGLDSNRCEIIEYGAIKVDRNRDSLTGFSLLAKPSIVLPDRITQLTGITQDMVDGATDQSTALKAFLEFIEDLPLVAFNAQFDMRFLKCTASRHGLEVKNRYTCAMKKAKRAWPQLRSHSLAHLAENSGLRVQNHRALGDCELTLPIFLAAVEAAGTRIQWLQSTKLSIRNEL